MSVQIGDWKRWPTDAEEAVNTVDSHHPGSALNHNGSLAHQQVTPHHAIFHCRPSITTATSREPTHQWNCERVWAVPDKWPGTANWHCSGCRNERPCIPARSDGKNSRAWCNLITCWSMPCRLRNVFAACKLFVDLVNRAALCARDGTVLFLLLACSPDIERSFVAGVAGWGVPSSIDMVLVNSHCSFQRSTGGLGVIKVYT
ncbi:hypothetical protein BU23DRAFT_565672 [Bimuria novae-zelandiae CBS 107.79]|uniref:Uncharacterized protein n=1 Tax=Bimuria novae-zelandiae CBS 107.79 TaxID=1447943 RepID=A0A6A5VH30_9PLEO|nr:hypothetical protein BU23DRAFT_565672 [Bimuria novae-zelandiae CBS 107.79]